MSYQVGFYEGGIEQAVKLDSVHCILPSHLLLLQARIVKLLRHGSFSQHTRDLEKSYRIRG